MSDNKRKEGDAICQDAAHAVHSETTPTETIAKSTVGSNAAQQVPTPSAAEKLTCENTDRELWREREGDYYADSIHVTESGGVGINCGGYVVVKPLREWHKLASRHSGQAVDRQGEWTPVYGSIDCGDGKSFLSCGTFENAKAICNAHSAALAANDEQWRERFRKFEKIEEKFGPASQRSEGQVVHYGACSEKQSDKLRDNIIARERYLKSQYAAREYWRWKYCDPVIRRVKVGASPTTDVAPSFL